MKVLVVEDSRTVRAYVEAVLRAEPDLEVLPPAFDGFAAVDLATRLQPDVVLMDLDLPGLGGLEAIAQIMRTRPCPVIVLSGTLGDAETGRTFAAFQAGAVEVLTKPHGLGAVDVARFRRDLLRTVRLMAQAQVVRRWPRAEPSAAGPGRPGPVLHGRTLVLIGASTGGPEILRALLEGLPAPLPFPVVISQHIVAGFEFGLASWLSQTGHACRVVEREARLEPGVVLVASAQGSLVLDGERVVSRAPRPGAPTPSVDDLFTSAASRASEVVALLLSGMGEDGARGLHALRSAGALTFTQAGATCVVDGMPAAARRLGASTWELSPPELVAALRQLLPVSPPQKAP